MYVYAFLVKAPSIVAVLAAVVGSSETAVSGLGTAAERIVAGVRETVRGHSETMAKVYKVLTK